MEVKRSAEEIHKLVVGTFGTDIGQKLLEHLKETILNRPTFKVGMSIEEVAFREGQKDIVNQIIKEFEDAGV